MSTISTKRLEAIEARAEPASENLTASEDPGGGRWTVKAPSLTPEVRVIVGGLDREADAALLCRARRDILDMAQAMSADRKLVDEIGKALRGVAAGLTGCDCAWQATEQIEALAARAAVHLAGQGYTV